LNAKERLEEMADKPSAFIRTTSSGTADRRWQLCLPL
jgi:hypothetical protein